MVYPLDSLHLNLAKILTADHAPWSRVIKEAPDGMMTRGATTVEVGIDVSVFVSGCMEKWLQWSLGGSACTFEC